MTRTIDRNALNLIAKMNRAFREYPMLSDGDRVAVALSGGYDSMSLLHLLHIRKPITPEKYDVIAIHIIGDSRGPYLCSEHKPIIDWLIEKRYPYIITPMQVAKDEKIPMNCQRCTWNRRSTLFKVATRLGCNKIAFGHHFDDMVETALLNLFYQGRMATMFPCASYFKGEFSLIRPFIYIHKKELNDFAKKNGFPDPPPECPQSNATKRKSIASLINILEKDYKNVKWNIFRSALNCMKMSDQSAEMNILFNKNRT